MKWTKVSKEVIDKAPEIIPLKKGELQVKYAKLLVKIDKAIKLLDNYQNNLYSKEARKTLDDDIERALSILQDEEVK